MALHRRLLPEPAKPIKPDVSLFIVNIVLLLILFFLATGSLVNTPDQGLRLSETRDLAIDQVPSPVLIVAENGQLTLDDAVIMVSDIPDAVPQGAVLHVLIDRTAPALDLLKLLDQPGMERMDIRLVTIHKRDGT